MSSPLLNGQVSVNEGRIRFLGFPETLEHVSGEIEIFGEEARFRRLRAILGGGELSGQGGAILEGLSVDSYRLEVSGANVRASYPEGFRGVYEGDLLLRGLEGAGHVADDQRFVDLVGDGVGRPVVLRVWVQS